MEALIIARHGDAPGDNLTPKGREQVRALSARLKTIVNGRQPAIISSNYERAVETAEIIAAALEVDGFEQATDLVYCNDDEEARYIINLIKSKSDGAAVVILVAHRDLTKTFPLYFGNWELGVRLNSRREGVDNGEAWVIDCREKTIQRI